MTIMTKRGQRDNVITYEHICDTTADMNSIEDRYKTLGSVCIVIKGSTGGMEVYIADSNKQWNPLGLIGGGSSGGYVDNERISALEARVTTLEETYLEPDIPDMTSAEEQPKVEGEIIPPDYGEQPVYTA